MNDMSELIKHEQREAIAIDLNIPIYSDLLDLLILNINNFSVLSLVYHKISCLLIGCFFSTGYRIKIKSI